MIRLDTIRSLYEHEHQLWAHCPACRRWAALNLERMIREGQGELVTIGRKPRCQICGTRGVWQLRPPTMRPAPAGVAYI